MSPEGAEDPVQQEGRFRDPTESLQGDLEVILALESAHHVARAKDIADRLGVRRGSVIGALKSLEEKGLIHYRPYSYITLTEEGRRLAEEVARRHGLLREFLRGVLQVDEQTAEETACRLEHAVDPLTLERLECFNAYVRSCPRAGGDWLASFVRFCRSGARGKNACASCIRGLKERHTEAKSTPAKGGRPSA